MSEENERKVTVDDLTDEDLDQLLTEGAKVKQKRYRRDNPYVRACVQCGYMFDQKEYDSVDACPGCGGVKTVELKQ